MIKLSSLIQEQEEPIDVVQYFWPNGQFVYDNFAKLPQEEKLDAAMAIISSSKRSELTESDVFHIILTVGKPYIKELYEFATKYLTPDQLVNTTDQVRAWHK